MANTMYIHIIAPSPVEPVVHIDHQTLDEETKLWLTDLECEVQIGYNIIATNNGHV